ncbi:MAG: hypothetical protein FWD85_13705 [Microbacteriaceae bacterium]|nr:hypothetical protein [Microbacteriaceae bacterium]
MKTRTRIEDWVAQAERELLANPTYDMWSRHVDELTDLQGHPITTLAESLDAYKTFLSRTTLDPVKFACQLEVTLPPSEELETQPLRLDAHGALDPKETPPALCLVRRRLLHLPMFEGEHYERTVPLRGPFPPGVQAVYSCFRPLERDEFRGDDYYRTLTLTNYPPELRTNGEIH